MSNSEKQDDIVTIREIFSIAFRNIHWIALVALFFGAAGVYYIKTTTPTYTGRMTVTQSDYFNSQKASPTGFLADLPFQIQTAPKETELQKLKTILTSYDLAEYLFEENVQDWLFEPATENEVDSIWFGHIQLNEEREQLIHTIQGYLSSITFKPTEDTDATEITFEASSAEIATKFLQLAIFSADRRLKQRTLEQIGNDISFLRKRAKEVTLVEHRNQLFALMAERLSQEMILNRPGFFAIEVINPTTSSPFPTWPVPRLIIPASLLVGAAIGLLLVFLVYAIRRPTLT